MGLLRKNFYLGEDQVNYLELLDKLSLSEHIRRALDDYISKLKSLNVSSSESKRGDDNG